MRIALGFAVSFALSYGAVWAQDGGRYERGYAPELDQAFTVGDVEITRDAIRREVIYGPGRAELLYQENRFLVEHQLKEHWTYDRTSHLLPDSIVQSELADKVAAFELKYPTLDLEVEIARAYRSRELYERGMRGDLLLEQTYIPANPDAWPAATFEALRKEAGDILIDDFRESYERRVEEYDQLVKAWNGFGARPAMRKEDSMYRSVLRTIVHDYLLGPNGSNSDVVRTQPEWVALLQSPTGDGPSRLLATSDLWRTIEHSVTSDELLMARRFLATIEASKQRLAKQGMLLPWDEAMARWEPSEPGETPKWGPYREAELAYAHVYESFRASIAHELLTSPQGALSFELQEHLPRANAHFGLSKVEMEVLPVLAFDMDAFRWKWGGWAAAEAKARALADGLSANPSAWADLLPEEGEYWNPPQPAYGRGCGEPISPLWNGKPRMRAIGDNRKALSESEYTEFTTGHGVAKYIFHEGAPGEIYGPLRGTNGFYLVKVLERVPTQRPLDLADAKHRELLIDHYVSERLLEFAHESLEMANVTARLDH